MSFLSNLFGGGNTTVTPAQINWGGPGSFSTGGTTTTYSGGQYNIGQTPALSGAIGGLQQTFQNQASALGGLANTVRPGFSQFRQAGLTDLANQNRANISNLRDNLAQRRVLGSSFANSSISQANADYAQNRANFIAQSYLQELQASQSLIQQQYQAATQAYTVGINQMNFETGLAAQLTSQATSASANVAEAQARLDQSAAEFNAKQAADSAAGIGKFAGSLLTAPAGSIAQTGLSALGSAGASALSGGASSIFGAIGDLLPIFAL